MKTRRHHLHGFTLIEMLISTVVCSLLFLCLYAFLNTTMVQFAKNTAVNVAHQQARGAILRMEQDIHSSVSLPQLVDVNRNPLATTGPAAGISFQLFAAGPYKIASTASAAQAKVSVNCGSYTPQVGQRLCIPSYQIELDITAVSGASGGVRTLTLAANLPQAVTVTMMVGGASQTVDVTGFITNRVAYVVANGELHYYGSKTGQTYSVIARNVTNGTPFSTPSTPVGSPNSRFVAAINFLTTDVTSSHRGFKVANMSLNSLASCRARLCAYQ